MSLLKRKKPKRVENGKKSDNEKAKSGSGRKGSPGKKRTISIKSQAFRIIRYPLITEKGTAISALNKYVFEVSGRAAKAEVKKAIEELYGVKVVKVNVMNFQGKRRRYGRGTGRTRTWKKAVVTLQKGDTIQLFEGV